MNDFWTNFLIEIALFTFLGVLYYFYQRRKIIKYEENKGPMIAGQLLQACLTERGEEPDPELDPLIEALDDYIHGKAQTPPVALMKHLISNSHCSPELKDVLREALSEL
jgi:hypothetical protein